MKKPGKIKIHREEAGGDKTFSVEGPKSALMPFFEHEGEVKLSEIASAISEEYDGGEIMVGCTAIESVGGMRGGLAVLKGYIVEPRYGISLDTKSYRPPTREEHCPACNGKGSVIRFDVEEMREERRALGLTQTAVAKAAGWRPTMVTELESGARPMTEVSAERYWKALQVAEKGAGHGG